MATPHLGVVSLLVMGCVGDNAQSNQERTKWTKKINRKLDNLEGQNCYP